MTSTLVGAMMVLHSVGGPASAWASRLLELDDGKRGRPEQQIAVVRHRLAPGFDRPRHPRCTDAMKL